MDPHLYTGRKACGCVVAAVVDDPKYPKSTARALSEFVRDGYTVERVPVEGFSFDRCIHGKKGQTDLALEGAA